MALSIFVFVLFCLLMVEYKTFIFILKNNGNIFFSMRKTAFYIFCLCLPVLWCSIAKPLQWLCFSLHVFQGDITKLKAPRWSAAGLTDTHRSVVFYFYLIWQQEKNPEVMACNHNTLASSKELFSWEISHKGKNLLNLRHQKITQLTHKLCCSVHFMVSWLPPSCPRILFSFALLCKLYI